MNPYYRGYRPYYRTSNSQNQDGRGLLLPFLVGAAVAFPIGYIASNTNTKNQPYPFQPMYQPYYQPYYPPQYNPMPYSPTPMMPYY